MSGESLHCQTGADTQDLRPIPQFPHDVPSLRGDHAVFLAKITDDVVLTRCSSNEPS